MNYIEASRGWNYVHCTWLAVKSFFGLLTRYIRLSTVTKSQHLGNVKRHILIEEPYGSLAVFHITQISICWACFKVKGQLCITHHIPYTRLCHFQTGWDPIESWKQWICPGHGKVNTNCTFRICKNCEKSMSKKQWCTNVLFLANITFFRVSVNILRPEQWAIWSIFHLYWIHIVINMSDGKCIGPKPSCSRKSLSPSISNVDNKFSELAFELYSSWWINWLKRNHSSSVAYYWKGIEILNEGLCNYSSL